jgi:hypothetical protein
MSLLCFAWLLFLLFCHCSVWLLFGHCSSVRVLFGTIGEEKRVSQWIVDRQHKKQCQKSMEVREFASSLRKDRTHYNIECSRHWWASFKSRHPDLGTELLAAIENADSEVSAENVRSYVAELDPALSVIWVPDERLNMDET